MTFTKLSVVFALASLAGGLHAQSVRTVQQKIADGILEGVVSADGKVRTFKGIPYAAPPVGPLRWKPPQPVIPWSGVRRAVDYGPRAMQGRIYDDMVFHDAGPSEDCLYLNLWLPEDQPHTKLPVMVWIHGGGFKAGSSSEPRQDGGNLCKKGVIVVSMNYRMGVFGLLALPELTKESGCNASGNYGLMDQIAALQWVRRNIADFGGDPDNVTIFGESAGSESVCGLMASPVARGLFQRAIGESGAIFGERSGAEPLAEAEAAGAKFVQATFGTTSLAALRAISADKLLAASLKNSPPDFTIIVDGYVLPASSRTIFGEGRQAHVPLLAGWNRDEGDYRQFFGKTAPTVANFAPQARVHLGRDADAFLRVYSAKTDAEAKRAAQDYEGDRFIAFGTWKWMELHRLTGGSPIFRYQFDQPLPLATDAPVGSERVVPHASDIEFVFRVLSSRQLPWTDDEHKTSELMATYWTNFAKNGDPNGSGVPPWPRYESENGFKIMHLQVTPVVTSDAHRARYEFLDGLKALE